MALNIGAPNLAELKPKITVFGVGGGGCNAVNNMIDSNLTGVEFVVANTDAQALAKSPCERKIQLGIEVTRGLGAGSQPEIGAQAAEETLGEIVDHLSGSNMVFITAGMGGGTGTGAAPVIAREARKEGILTVGVVTKPFNFEGRRRMAIAERGIEELAQNVDTLIVIPNQNLFRVANEATSFKAAFAMADQVLYSGVASITELMTKEGLINLDFADVRAVMSDMGKAMMGTGEASGDNRAEEAALAAISNPLLDIESMAGARGVLISIAGGPDLTLYEVDMAASRIREEVDPDANIIVGATIEEELEGTMRVSVVATGLQESGKLAAPVEMGPAHAGAHRPGDAGGDAGESGVNRNETSTSPRGISIPVPPVMYPRPEEVTSRPDSPRQAAPERPVHETAHSEAPQSWRNTTRMEPEAMQPEESAEGFGEEVAELPSSTPPSDNGTGVNPADKTNRAHEMGAGVERPVQTPVSSAPPQSAPEAPQNATQPRACHPDTEAQNPALNFNVSDLPPHIQELVAKKQEQINQLGGNKRPKGSRRRRLYQLVKNMVGAGQSASGNEPVKNQPSAGNAMPGAGAQKPQRSAAPSAPLAGGKQESPLADDDDLNIPAFLRRRGSVG